MKMTKPEHVKALVQNNDYIKFGEGDVTLRVIGDIHSVREHRHQMPDGSWKNVVCPTEMKRDLINAGETQDFEVPPCPFCEAGVKVDKAFIAYAINRADQKAYILKKGPRLMDPIIALKLNEDWGMGDDYDVKITVTGQKLATKYQVQAVPKEKSKSLTERETFNLNQLKEKVDFEKMTLPRPYAEIKDIMGGKTVDDVPF